MKLFGGKKGDDKAPMQGDATKRATTTRRSRPCRCRTRAPRARGLVDERGAGGAAARPAAGSSKVVVDQHDDEPRPHYGIEQAIQLMRALPIDQNPALVVAVIKTTLESLKVKVSDIISDAARKQKDLEERVSNLKRAIADFEKEIETRKRGDRAPRGRPQGDDRRARPARARREGARVQGAVAKTG